METALCLSWTNANVSLLTKILKKEKKEVEKGRRKKLAFGNI